MGIRERLQRRAPGLHRGLPLLFLGALFLVAGGYFLGAHSTEGLGRFPIWLYLLPVGAVAFVGGAATSFFPEEDAEEIVDGSPIGENLVAVSAGDWEEFLRWNESRASAGTRSSGPRGYGLRTLGRLPPTVGPPPGPGARNMMAASFAFAPALASDAPATPRRRARAGLGEAPPASPEESTAASKQSEEPATTSP